MAERLSGLMLLGLVLWTGVGAVGLVAARWRGERGRFRRGAGTLIAIWVGYMGVLAGVSLAQKAKVVRPGSEQCFGVICFAVSGVEEPRGFLVRGEEPERLLRVAVRMRNTDREHANGEEGLVASLVDGQGRHWEPVPGLGGVRLTTRLAAGGSTLSEPVFRVAKDATDLRLVLRHSGWTRARLRIGDAESYFHRPAEMWLPVGER